MIHLFIDQRAVLVHWALAALALGACVPDLDDGASLVEGRRVLAVVSEPPEAGEGDSVSLSALVASDSAASADTVASAELAASADAAEVSYFFCRARKPLSELGPVDASCLDSDAVERVALGRGSTVSAAIDRDACSRFGPRRPSAEPGQPAARAVDPDATGGFYQPLSAELAAEGVVLGGVRLDCGLPNADRALVIDYNQRHRVNQNPRVDRVEVFQSEAWSELPATAAWPVHPGERLVLRASWAVCETDERCTGAETFVMFDPERRALGDRTEAMLASWYATAGEFDEHRSEPAAGAPMAENGWIAPSGPASIGLWVVLRDGRGGVGYAVRRLSVEPAE